MKKHRVVVTGMGVVAPNASSIDDFRDALLAGRSGVGPITIFDTADLPTRIAGESRVPERADFTGRREDGKVLFLKKQENSGLPAFPPSCEIWGGAHALKDRKILFALEAARQAHAAATACGSAPAGVGGVSMGVGLELFAMEDLVRSRQAGFVLPESLAERLAFMQTPSDLSVAMMSRAYGATAPPVVHVSACAAGTDAVGTAYRLVATGRRDFMLAGGTDSMINPLGVAGFCALSATSTKNGEPER
ncbi:MAG: hypothetical protein JWM74_826, partial [Myxococcaceae bacterium]|nr:hypothetical protein [Myxococcaceae bacterium]